MSSTSPTKVLVLDGGEMCPDLQPQEEEQSSEEEDPHGEDTTSHLHD